MTRNVTDIEFTNSDNRNDEQDKKSDIGMTVGFSGVHEGRWLKVSASLNYELPLPMISDNEKFVEAKKQLDELYDFLEAAVLEKYVIFCESSEVVNEI